MTESRIKMRPMLTAVARAALVILVRVVLFGMTVTVTTVPQITLAPLPLAMTEFRTAMKLILTVVARAQQSVVKVKDV